MRNVLDDKKKVFVEIILSMVCAWYAVFVSGRIMSGAVGNENAASSVLLESGVGIVVLIASFVLLFYMKGKQSKRRGDKVSVSEAVLRLLVTGVFFVLITVLASFLSGIIAVMVNKSMQGSTALDSI